MQNKSPRRFSFRHSRDSVRSRGERSPRSPAAQFEPRIKKTYPSNKRTAGTAAALCRLLDISDVLSWRATMTGPDKLGYLHRAKECRAMAERFREPETRRLILQIAAEYDRMAMQAATLEIQLQELAASTLMKRNRGA